MASEIFSWPNLRERMCRTRGSIVVPLASQATSLPTELPCPVNFAKGGQLIDEDQHSSLRVYSVTFHLMFVNSYYLILVRFRLLSGHLLGKNLATRLTICSLCTLTICNFS